MSLKGSLKNPQGRGEAGVEGGEAKGVLAVLAAGHVSRPMDNRGHAQLAALLARLPGMLATKGLQRMNEYRLYITVPDLAVAQEQWWKPLISELEKHHSDLGPIISFGDGNAEVVVSMEADSEAHAVQRAVDAIAESLHRVGLGDHYPAAVEVETEHEPVPA